MAGNVTIRQATAEDSSLLHEAILKLAQGIGTVGKVASSPDDLCLHGFGDLPAFKALIAEVDGAFAGMCLYFPSFSTWRGKPGIYVQDIYVEPGLRGRNVGEQLLQAVARQERTSGAAYLRLSVDAQNIGAQAFYARIGLEHSQSEQIYGIYGDAFAALAEREIGRERK
jgi:ribosomal protein S18 acetylase RimI-like enzyme